MKLRFELRKTQYFFIQLILSLFWLTKMTYSNSYIVTYILVAVAGVFCLCQNRVCQNTLIGWRKAVVLTCSVLFSVATSLANYDLFLSTYQIVVILPLSFLGAISLAWNILVFFYHYFQEKFSKESNSEIRQHTVGVFLCSFIAIVTLDCLFLFLADYPGTLTPDSLSQMNQLISGNYTNHHPFWHTVVIKFWIELGLKVFGNYNDAVALYSIWQIAFLALCFSYSVMTLYQARIPKCVILCVFCIFLLSPFNIAFSYTMWKDVVFGGAVLLFVTSLYRILKGIGKHHILNYLVFALAGIGFGVWRSNGWLASLAAFVLCFFFMKKDEKKVLIIWMMSLILSWIMKGPILSGLNISQPDLVESLSIPVQQVARVINNECELTDEETYLISCVVDMEEVPGLFKPYISDPIKDEIRSKNNSYFEENILQYFKIWVKIGIRYPMEYIKAWVDQTKGYWNGGYSYWVMAGHIPDNEIGIYKTKVENLFSQKMWIMLYNTENIPELEIIFSIGFHVWLVAFAFTFNVICKRKEALLSVPILTIVLTLLVATPVFSEFRYAYTVFTTFPFILSVTFAQGNRKSEMSKNLM